MPVDASIFADLQGRIQSLRASGDLRPVAELAGFHSTFRARFGPEVLRGLDGPVLLDTLLHLGNPQSLVYWLEFKNDEEFPAIFGSIQGGSALKFGIYRRKETGVWMTGHPSAQRALTEPEAVEIARRDRDQFIAGAAAVTRAATHPESIDYAALQDEMMSVAPDVADTAWGHKYFSLLASTVLDDYHAPQYQQFHLIKLAITPPTKPGRYVAAKDYLSLARQLDVPVNHLTTTLNARDGSPHHYWRIGTGTATVPRSQWSAMRDGNCIAVGWSHTGDLSTLEPTQAARDDLKARIAKLYNLSSAQAGNAAPQLFKFVTTVKPGDMVLASDGATILGIGRVTGDYTFVEGQDFPHRRPVTWLTLDEWRLPTDEGLRTTLFDLRKPGNLVAIESHMLAVKPDVADPTRRFPAQNIAGPSPRSLDPMTARVAAVLERKGQVILYGPPGTGKTHHAEASVRELAARAWFASSFVDLPQSDRTTLLGENGAVEMCCFHPAYGYEDFLEGYRPLTRDGVLVFERRDGVFKRLCTRARGRPDKPFYLIIDEINRGDIPRIFGELLTVLEKSRREVTITLPVSGQRFAVPTNIFVVGTMNTADRSIALLDTALRRRFGFIELMPESSVLGSASAGGVPLAPWLDALNERILRHAGRDARNLQVGHAYLLHGGHPVTDLGRFAQILRDDIVPLLEEYCYEDYVALERILGPTMVQRDRQRIDDRLFAADRQEDLVRALLEPCPEITASIQAVASEAATLVEDADDTPEDPGGSPA